MNSEENLELDENYDLAFKKDDNEIENQFPYITDPNLMRTFINEEESISAISYHVSTIEFDRECIREIDNNYFEESEEEEEEAEGPYFDLYDAPTRKPTINIYD